MNSQVEKRVTIRLKCPNPLFEEWLITWRDQAILKESKMQYTFNQALDSLRKYPLSLDSGRECKILKGFGDKLCKMLDDKLNEHRKTTGNIRIQSSKILLTPNENLNNEASEKRNNENKKAKTMPKTITSNKEKDTSTNHYIPQHGSGSYAILVTLYTQSLKPDYVGYLKKAEIIQHGTHLVNSSFTKPDPGSRYSAWSSMRTLLTKKLVSKVSHPPKFTLTEDGRILAKNLYDNSFRDKNDTFNTTLKDQYYYGKDSVNCKKDEEMNKNYIYISKSYDVDIPDEFTSEFLEGPRNPKNDTFSVNSESLSKSPKNNKSLNVETNISSSNNVSEIKHIEKSRYSDGAISIELPIRKKSKKQEKLTFERFASSPSISSPKQSDEWDILFQQKNKKTIQKYSSTNTVCSASNFVQTNTKHSLKRYTSSSSVASTKSTASIFENFVMAPHSFDIILFVDTNETSGSANIDNDDIIIRLNKSGIKYEVKNLKIGDFTWICRERIFGKELILPYIVERKRMDDFAHSIRDKRYHEQKFRLKKSAIENLTYLVESYGRNQHLGLPLQTLYQAASNTAIQENFFIKFTENTNETVEYLVNFSKILIEMFKSKTLSSCAKDDIESLDINSDLIPLMTFKDFNESSVKNKRMKVSDLFVKMLVQIKGMSVERALAITQKYPTPFLLKMEYNRNPDRISEKLLSTIKYGTHGKSLGAVLSQTVYQAFSKMQY